MDGVLVVSGTMRRGGWKLYSHFHTWSGNRAEPIRPYNWLLRRLTNDMRENCSSSNF
jgi:hypothetical protein